MRSAIPLSPLAARRFALRALGLEVPFPSVDAALTHLGYVQIDPLNICGRMHDLILRNRIAGYREGDLMRHLHGNRGDPDESTVAASDRSPKDMGDVAKLGAPPSPAGTSPTEARRPPVMPQPAEQRTAFEHHVPDTHILVAFPLEAWPHLRAAMRARARRTGAWSGRLTPTEQKLAPLLLAEIARRGPLSSDEFDDRRRAHRTVWGASSLVKSTLQKLFFHGELLIAERNKHRRRYDLPGRVLPEAIVGLPEAAPAETARWLALLKLRQRRLATLKRNEVPLVEDAVQRVAVEGCPPLFCLKTDAPLLEACRDEQAVRTRTDRSTKRSGPGGVRLLAPLDPLIYDRRLTAQLWGFEYTWEAYTPAAKRIRGHYALPVLSGTELIGHVEPKADREAGRLRVASRSIARGHRTSEALDELAAWLGLRR